jgi:hypothetical protein
MTLHLLDADVLIRAHEDYYPVDRVAPFWAWLLQQAVDGSVKRSCPKPWCSNGVLSSVGCSLRLPWAAS